METEDKNNPSDFDLDELSIVTEALIFGADEPVRPETIAEVFSAVRGTRRPRRTDIEASVGHLNSQFEASGRCVRIYEWSEGYRMATTPDVAPFLKLFLDQKRSRRLSRSLLETLAVVAYKQPVTKPEVDFVRGVDSDYGLRKLMELDMVDVIGRSEAVGRPLLYGTSSTFLEKFGLRTLQDLPNLREVEEILNDPAFNSEKARMVLMESLGAQASEAKDVSDESTSTDVESSGQASPSTNGSHPQ
ncbi:MAG: SMC-Scp complex subunit ScpB [Rhodothermales bacterium]|nr:SMC-Scp complex subunit ScpB [Rhodothermales bacterium]